MPCDDCPEKLPFVNQAIVEAPRIGPPAQPPVCYGWVIYTGGPPEIHLATLQTTLPPEYTKARVLRDGSIEYEKGLGDWEPPSPIDGYIQDQKEPWLFRPQWESCIWRAYALEERANCRCLNVLARCNNPVAPTLGRQVDFATCRACASRMAIPPNGTINPLSLIPAAGPRATSAPRSPQDQ